MSLKVAAVVAFDKEFLVPTTVMLSSLIRTTKLEMEIHAIVPRIESATISDYFRIWLSQKYPSQIFHFYNFDGDLLLNKNIEMQYAHFTNAALFRLFMSSLLPKDVDQIIYLDGDLLVRNTKKLIDIYWEKPIFAARSFPNIIEGDSGRNKKSKNFNSGVFITSLDYWRQRNVEKELLSFLVNNPNSILKDQDALNIVFGEISQELPEELNSPFFRLNKYKQQDIIHFMGSVKPWKSHCPEIRATKQWRREFKNIYGYSIKLESVKLFRIKKIVLSCMLLRNFICEIMSYSLKGIKRA
jgi:lipopolysaccharide biosynthesis glycosyltransferase